MAGKLSLANTSPWYAGCVFTGQSNGDRQFPACGGSDKNIKGVAFLFIFPILCLHMLEGLACRLLKQTV